MRTQKFIYFLFILFFYSFVSYSQNSSKYKQNLYKYPQTIHASDYEAIRFIENLYTSLSKLNKNKVDCNVQKDILTFYSPARPRKVTNLQMNTENTVLLNRARYSDISVAVLFRTLNRALSNFSKKTPIESVKYIQFPTISYKKRTIIEFKIENQVVVLTSDSNGPRNKDRLYVYEIVKPKDSFFWGAMK